MLSVCLHVFILQVQDEVDQPGDVCQHGGALHVPLGVRDDVVTPLAAGVSPAQLYVLHGELPQRQIVGVHVEVGQQSSSEGICLWRQVQTWSKRWSDLRLKVSHPRGL